MHGDLERFGHTVRLGVVEQHLDIDLGGRLARVVEHDSLLIGVGADAVWEHPHRFGRGRAEHRGHRRREALGVVADDLHLFGDHPPGPDVDRRGQLLTQRDHVAHDERGHLAAGHHQTLERLRCARAVLGLEVHVDDGFGRKRVEQREQESTTGPRRRLREEPRGRGS